MLPLHHPSTDFATSVLPSPAIVAGSRHDRGSCPAETYSQRECSSIIFCVCLLLKQAEIQVNEGKVLFYFVKTRTTACV